MGALASAGTVVENLSLGADGGIAFLTAAALVVEDVTWVTALVDTVDACGFSLLEIIERERERERERE